MRWPEPTREQLLAGFTPPPHFANATFESYLPQDPSQAAAVADLRAFAGQVSAPRRRGLFRQPPPLRGRYLDGGFGVGKTHLLAALWHAVDVPAAFGTFVGYTNLVGALGFTSVVDTLSEFRLVCIDEFELDDPGDTVLMSTLCTRLVERGVVLAATSNTLPDQLGEGRFAADDFLREIQGLAAHFDVLRIDGEDYRHLNVIEHVRAWESTAVRDAVEGIPGAVVDAFDALLAHLARVHPSRYRELLRDVTAVGLLDVHTMYDQSDALRFVVFVDRLYDLDIPVYTSGVNLDALYAPDLLRGGYRKKYFRSLSRLAALHV
jgi:cell division protein ZapE